MGGSRVGHYGRIQGGSLWGHRRCLIRGRFRVGQHVWIKDGLSLVDLGWVIMGGSRVGQ